MRNVWLILLGCLLLAGCKRMRSGSDTSPGTQPGAAGVSNETPPAAKGAAQPRMTPVSELSGRIASVRPELRIVVVDFFVGQLPRVDQRMGIYRQGQKVGEVKISGPELNNMIAGDIIAGEARVGDEVRSF